MIFIIFLFIFQICFFQTLISGDGKLSEDLFLANKNEMKELRLRNNLKKSCSLSSVRYKFSYQHIDFSSNISLGCLFSASFSLLTKKYFLSKNYKNIFFLCYIGSLFLPFFISARKVKNIHYSFTYENMLKNFEKLKVKIFSKNIFSLINKEKIFIDYYINFFKKTDIFSILQDHDDINKYKALMNFFLVKDESAKKETIKKYFQYVIMIDQDRKTDTKSIFFPEHLDKSLILEFSDGQCLKIIDIYYKNKIDSIVDVFNEIYSGEKNKKEDILSDINKNKINSILDGFDEMYLECKKKKIENILSHINTDILLKIVLNQKLSQEIYTYIMENFRYEIIHEINKKHREVSRIQEEVQFSNDFEIYENNKREIENTQKREEQMVRAFFFDKLDLKTIFEKNINNLIAFPKLIYTYFFYDYLPIVNFFKDCKDDDEIAKILSILFYYNRYFTSDNNKDPKEFFFKIITSSDLGDIAKNLISSEFFKVSEEDFESVLNLKFCYGKTQAVGRYHELLTELKNKHKLLF